MYYRKLYGWFAFAFYIDHTYGMYTIVEFHDSLEKVAASIGILYVLYGTIRYAYRTVAKKTRGQDGALYTQLES